MFHILRVLKMARSSILIWTFLCLVVVLSIVFVINVVCKKVDDHKLDDVDPVIVYWPEVNNEISCHNSFDNDALQSVDDPSFAPKTKSIFFHETSCRGGIDSQQACAVESAARSHPNWDVYILFNSPVNDTILKKSCIAKLLKYSNVKVARIHTYSFTKNTVVEKVVKNNLPKSVYPIEHLADIMKMLALNKWGGTYLDLDVLVQKPFDNLPQNWIAKETADELSSGVMAFSKNGYGKNVTSAVLQEISHSYNHKSYAHNGASAIQRVLQKRCGNITRVYGNCKGVSIFAHYLFYPIHYTWSHILFNKGPLPASVQEPYTNHMWTKLLYPVHIESPFAKLAAKYCPNIFYMYGKAFGS